MVSIRKSLIIMHCYCGLFVYFCICVWIRDFIWLSVGPSVFFFFLLSSFDGHICLPIFVSSFLIKRCFVFLSFSLSFLISNLHILLIYIFFVRSFLVFDIIITTSMLWSGSNTKSHNMQLICSKCITEANAFGWFSITKACLSLV